MSQSLTTGTDSARGDLAALARRKNDGWMLFLFELLVILRCLADPPKEKELRADLYVMF
jgi:hypothetical protein